jgi:hypothetical protein
MRLSAVLLGLVAISLSTVSILPHPVALDTLGLFSSVEQVVAALGMGVGGIGALLLVFMVKLPRSSVG